MDWETYRASSGDTATVRAQRQEAAPAVLCQESWGRPGENRLSGAAQPPEAATATPFADAFREVRELFGQRDIAEDSRKDQKSVEAELADNRLEAGINQLTKDVLLKDADKYPPIKNSDGSSSYRVVQIGMTDRPISAGEATSARFYCRTVDITVPGSARNLGECNFHFNARQHINEDEFQRLLEQDKSRLSLLEASQQNSEAKNPNAEAVNIHTHGVFTYTDMADTEALLLELTNGHPTVNVDWQSFPNTRKHPHHFSPHDFVLSSYLHYMEDRASAEKANGELQPLLDRTIAAIGARNTTMIGFSHGGMFDTRYLHHRVETGLPPVKMVIFAHPDVAIRTPDLKVDCSGLLSRAARCSFVIGGRTDSALKVAAFVPGAGGERLGDDSLRARKTIDSNHGDPVSEIVRIDTKFNDEHFLNYSGIASLENGPAGRTPAQLQTNYKEATEVGRRRFRASH